MLVTRARMSTLFALVKTHNYLIYISFPPQNRMPLCASALPLPPPTIRVIIQSASELRVGEGKAPMIRTGTGGEGSWTGADREKAHGRKDVQTGNASKGYFLGRKSPETETLKLTRLDLLSVRGYSIQPQSAALCK